MLSQDLHRKPTHEPHKWTFLLTLARHLPFMFLEAFLSTFPFNVLNAGSYFFSHPSWVRISPVAKRLCPVTFHSWQPRGDVASTEASPLYLSVWLIVFCVYCSRSGLDLLLRAIPWDTPFKFLLKLELDLCVDLDCQYPRALGDTRVVARSQSTTCSQQPNWGSFFPK